MLTADFINVGYGDAALIRETSSGFSMLVDCGDVTAGENGPQSRRICAADFLKQEGIEELDLLVLTHLHRDHSGGLLDVLHACRVREFWTGFLPPRSLWDNKVPISDAYSPGAVCLAESLDIYLGSLKEMNRQGSRIRVFPSEKQEFLIAHGVVLQVQTGKPALLARQQEIFLRVLGGEPDAKGLDELDLFINNVSIRLRVEYAGRSMELPGDLSAGAWDQTEVKACDLVKLPHHGHVDSMTEHLLSRLDPEVVVISTSNTRTDDCPSTRVLRMLDARGIRPYFTDAVSAYPGEKPDYHQSVRASVLDNGALSMDLYNGRKRYAAAAEV